MNFEKSFSIALLFFCVCLLFIAVLYGDILLKHRDEINAIQTYMLSIQQGRD